MARDIDIKADGVQIHVNTSDLMERANDAQFWLDSQIMTDMVPLMPHQTWTFINVTRARSAALAGSGKVVAAAPPIGRFLYECKVMVDPETGSPWARAGAKKIVTDRPLKYSNPSAVPHWFEAAKETHMSEWIDGVKKKIGGES